jgi:hypothetical protein
VPRLGRFNSTRSGGFRTGRLQTALLVATIKCRDRELNGIVLRAELQHHRKQKPRFERRACIGIAAARLQKCLHDIIGQQREL